MKKKNTTRECIALYVMAPGVISCSINFPRGNLIFAFKFIIIQSTVRNTPMIIFNKIHFFFYFNIFKNQSKRYIKFDNIFYIVVIWVYFVSRSFLVAELNNKVLHDDNE